MTPGIPTVNDDYAPGAHKRDINDDEPNIIEEFRQYIRDFDGRIDKTSTTLELCNAMLKLHPDRINCGAFWCSAHALKGQLAYTDQWDWRQAEREYKLALASGSHGAAESSYGWYLMTRGRFAESRHHLQIAAELDPLSLGPQLNQVGELTQESNDAEAKRKLESALEIVRRPAAAVSLSSGPGWAEWYPRAAAVWWRCRLVAGCPVSCGTDPGRWSRRSPRSRRRTS